MLLLPYVPSDDMTVKMHSMYEAHPESKNQSCVGAVQVTCVLRVKVSHYPYIKRNVCCLV